MALARLLTGLVSGAVARPVIDVSAHRQQQRAAAERLIELIEKVSGAGVSRRSQVTFWRANPAAGQRRQSEEGGQGTPPSRALLQR